MGFSYWEERTFLSNIDLLVVGGGIVGLSAAIYAKRKNPSMRIVVAERDVFSAGASTKNAGFACFGSPGEILDDLTHIPEEEVFSTVEKRILGLENLKELIGPDQMGFEATGGYEVFRSSEADSFNACLEKMAYLNGKMRSYFGEDVYQNIDVSDSHWGFQGIEHAIGNRFEGMIDTGEMMRMLMQIAASHGVQLLNGILIDKLESFSGGVICRVAEDQFIARQVIVCTNGMATQLLQELPVIPARNQVLVTSEMPKLSFSATFHMHKGYVYFRNIGRRVLIGGFRHLDAENEQTWNFGLSDIIQLELERTLRDEILPGQSFTIDKRWSGIMGLGASKKPIIKQIDPHLFVAVRMGGMGVAIGSLVGKEVAELALG